MKLIQFHQLPSQTGSRRLMISETQNAEGFRKLSRNILEVRRTLNRLETERDRLVEEEGRREGGSEEG